MSSGSSSIQTENTFIRETKYLLYLPEEYSEDSSKRWPLLVFLHGAGERGNDLSLVKVHGPPKLIEAGERPPFIVASPQVPLNEWWSPDIVSWLTRDLITRYRVDEDRVYLTGLSMGGYGTWETAARYPELFAAIAPICGRGDPGMAWKLRHMPAWIFHGAKDSVVSVRYSEAMNDALKQYGKVKLTIYPEADHDSWTETYGNEELYRWFLSHRRFRFTEAPPPPELDRYEGKYVADYNSAEIFLKEGRLFIRLETAGNREQMLTPISGGGFTFGEMIQSEIIFSPSCASFIHYQRQMEHFRRE